ncbi:hypothetical protein [Sorangium sp. So ce1000]|uniref:hypothetical protein n=1 Tax=Sorangium sp. So ce1000 TaxID=3133325 RepID=UPI003F63F15A
MGVHVILDIDPRGIDEAEWAATYDETLALLSAWQPRLLDGVGRHRSRAGRGSQAAGCAPPRPRAAAARARRCLGAFRKPPGAPYTVASLLGSFFLDKVAMGRHLRITIEPAAITADLSEVFGDRGAALATRLREKSATIEAHLREHADGLDAFVARAGDVAGDDTEALAVLRSADAMGPNQRTWVRAMAWSVMTVLAGLRGGDPKIAEALDDAEQGKRLLVRTLAEGSPVLTEDAWNGVLAERRADVIAWWIALVSMRASELHASQVCRAFFENAELRAYAIAIGRDEREMRALGELAAKVRTAGGGDR